MSRPRSCLISYSIFLVLPILFSHGNCSRIHRHHHGDSFVQTRGTQFEKKGEPLFLNGFNAYWMMVSAADVSKRGEITASFRQASEKGLNIARTWGFSDGGDIPLQYSPGKYNEDVFKGLDFVLSEAGKYGIHVIVSLVNNFHDYGGKPQYVKWAKERGQSSDVKEDDFFTNPIVKGYYKNHIKTMLTRNNTITGVLYKDDPTILAWELMNEPRCPSDPSGKQLQEWIREMAAHLKSIDAKHLLEVGLEGFYGDSGKSKNPNNSPTGTDFIANNQIPQVDFATIHIYPESWLPSPQNSSNEAQQKFAKDWIKAHIEDSHSVLKKPLVIGEFGKSHKNPNFTSEQRDNYFKTVYDGIYDSVKSKGPCVGGIFWQLMTPGISMGDGYEVFLDSNQSTAAIIAQQSRRLALVSS